MTQLNQDLKFKIGFIDAEPNFFTEECSKLLDRWAKTLELQQEEYSHLIMTNINNLNKINLKQYEVIVPLGIVATNFFIQKNLMEVKATPLTLNGNRIFPMLHPGYCLKNPSYNWLYDLEKLKKLMVEKQIEIKEMQDLTHLHVHSEFSCLDSIARIPDLIKKAKELGFKNLALTDHGTLRGVYKFIKECKQQEIKPIIGAEIYLDYNNDKADRAHLVLLVKNEEGYKNLCKLITKAHENFYRRPLTTWETLEQFNFGLICLTSCTSSPISKALKAGQPSKAVDYVNKLRLIFFKDLFLEIQPNDLEDQVILNKFIYQIAEKEKISVSVSNDIHYLNPNDHEFHNVFKAISYNIRMKENPGFSTIGFFFKTREQLESTFKYNHPYLTEEFIKKAIKNTQDIAERCNFDFKYQGVILPKFIIPDYQFPNETYLKELAYAKLKEKDLDDKPEYFKQLILELNRITEKKFTDYILIVNDLIGWAKQNGILCGSARGSVAGSLLCYLLGITEVDPIKHNLLFDRFISPIRSDLPDIDMDFQDDRRNEVIEYLKQKYGSDCVSHIGVPSYLKGKAALRDVCRVFEIPIWEVNQISPLIIQRSGGDARADYTLTDSFTEFEQCKNFNKKYPKIVEAAIKLEGNIRHITTHAAGVLITPKPIVEYMSLERYNSEIISGFDHYDIEEMGLLKLDILGLNTLTIIQKTLELIKQNHNQTIDIYKLEYNDSKIYDSVFKNGNTIGIFQFETKGLRKLCKNLKINSFTLLADANALHRPGSLHSGITADYVLRRNGQQKIKYIHDSVIPYTKDTLGLVIYQEQVMQILHDVGKLSWQHSDIARKIMSKSKGKQEFEKYRKMFVEGAVTLGLKEKIAEDIYNQVSQFGSYGFNKSHAVGYAIIAYWCAYLKTYYPAEFMYAAIKYSTKIRTAEYIREARKLGLKIYHPDINLSGESFGLLSKEEMILGLTDIKAISKHFSEKIIKNRPFISLDEFIKKVKPTENILKNLAASGGFDNLNITRSFIYENAKALLEGGQTIIKEWKLAEQEIKQREVVDYPSERASVDLYEELYEQFSVPITPLSELDFTESHDEVWIKGVVTFINFKQEGLEGQWALFEAGLERRYAHLNVDDGTDFVLVHLSPEQYTYYKKYLERTNEFPVLIKGHTIKNLTKVYCDAMIVIDDIDQSNPILKYIKDKRQEDIKKCSLQERAGFKVNVIRSVKYSVSKNRKPYARINFYDNSTSLCFNLTPQIFIAGEILIYKANGDNPFIKIEERR